MIDTNRIRDGVTPPALYFNRREWIRATAAVGSVVATASLYRWFNPVAKMGAQTAPIEALSVATESPEELLALVGGSMNHQLLRAAF